MKKRKGLSDGYAGPAAGIAAADRPFFILPLRRPPQQRGTAWFPRGLFEGQTHLLLTEEALVHELDVLDDGLESHVRKDVLLEVNARGDLG